ncbi:potassium channel family protein [Thalassoroseus pseudoceratinae]|uniref:potassium channel family protein n=1 Tax=Thalassoroseus pseudoceratinae TaxID=2713176 RepID=UPI0014247408
MRRSAKPQKKETSKQVKLVLSVLSAYAAIGLVFFPSLYWWFGINGNPPRTWDSFGESVYFSWITITTTGYGELHPSPGWPRIWACLEVGSGIVLLVFGVGYVFANIKK